ncbi:MAG: tRNA guanosine(34) transglycosylase Tgt [Ignavibacteria bacterium GWA2_54_16]|nr:MAG: tRNA guanosine(34) transglycosylase Tgt [Ignavibacteria bacterium GWA2_54_16]
MKFEILKTDGKARAGKLETGHGVVETPVFMPVGTQGSVKAIEHRELEGIGAGIILGNTYHLYLRPGADLIRAAGGLHNFIGWKRTILTDSGGYQVFSLNDLRTIEEKGVTFKSHLDGSVHVFTPETVVGIQRELGSDVMMVLDECAPFPCDREYASKSNELTVRWAERCKGEFERSKPLYGHSQALFGIVQGSIYPDLREQSVRSLVGMGFDGYAIGGLAVGESAGEMYRMLEITEPFLPREKPRYLMGVGTPVNLLEAVGRGIDMFDCVLPTRNGRNAYLFTRLGSLNLRNSKYKTDLTPPDAKCDCYTCTHFSRAYLRHLFLVREIVGLQLATIHNLSFYLWLMQQARAAVFEKRYDVWKRSMLSQLEPDESVMSLN